jgi:hypothetical protein
MSRIPILLVLFLVTAPALALDGVEVVETTAELRFEAFGMPSPTPSFCYYVRETSPGPLPVVTEADGDGNHCVDAWSLRCDADGLGFAGEWPLNDHPYLLTIEYRVDLGCSVQLNERTRLCAERTILSGELDISTHSLSLRPSGFAEEWLLDPDGGPDAVQVVLEPGLYELTLHVQAFRDKPFSQAVEPYSGSLSLVWEDPDSVRYETASWGALKAVYGR